MGIIAVVSVAVPFSELSLSERFSRVMAGLQRAVAARAAADRALAPMLVLLWGRIGRLTRRFTSIAARVRAGRSVRIAAVRARPEARAERAPREFSSVRWPREFGWLFRWVPATPSGSQLQHLMADKEMAEILAASPQARRVMRSLCRMLAIAPGPELDGPKRPKRARPEREPKLPDPASPIQPSCAKVPRERIPRTPGLGWLRWRSAKEGG